MRINNAQFLFYKLVSVKDQLILAINGKFIHLICGNYNLK